jgi:nicotinamide mononucleotide transporter
MSSIAQVLAIRWLPGNYIEILGVISSLIYLYFSVKQKIWLWPFGIVSSSLFIYIFYRTMFYAGMSLQVYYLAISFYGWYHWRSVPNEDQPSGQLPVSRVTLRTALYSSAVFAGLFITAALMLDRYTPSDVPWGDSFTTAGSVIATWMLARKILEHWLLWIVIDAVAVSLYFYKGMYPTVFLYLVYTFIAVIGYFQWKKTIKQDIGL